MFLEVLCEGISDVPILREILTRRFGLRDGEAFRIHPHQGKGKLPTNPLAKPDPVRRGLLDQLPAKLRALGKSENSNYKYVVLVVVDADGDDCKVLKQNLVKLFETLKPKPSLALFRIAVEEIESWLIADVRAIKRAYSGAKVASLRKIEPDTVCGAWERLAESLGRSPRECGGGDKIEWATVIAPHLDLVTPRSVSLKTLVDGLARILES